MCVQKFKFVALPIPEIIRGIQKFCQFLDTPTLRKKISGLLFGWTRRMYRPNLKSVALPVREIIAIEVLGGDCKPQILGK